MSDERRGSVTSLLAHAPEYYSPPSPSECPEPEDDCWDDLRPRPRRAPKRAAEVKKKEEDIVAADKKKEDESAGQKAEQPKAFGPQKKVSSDDAKKSDTSTGLGKTQTKKKVTAKDAKKPTEQKEAPAPEEEEPEAPPPKPVFMRGCSGAYQRAVEHVRGATTAPSIVVLGLPQTEKVEEPIFWPSHMDKSSFVAMAASRLKMKGTRSNDDSSITSESFDLRRDEKGRPGKKFFDDAYISTWSQSILPADESLFAITFNAKEKPPLQKRGLSVGRLRREASWEMKASEWSDWRSVHDRVDQWLKDNGRVEPDESHLTAILQDLQPKKPLFLR